MDSLQNVAPEQARTADIRKSILSMSTALYSTELRDPAEKHYLLRFRLLLPDKLNMQLSASILISISCAL